MDTYSTWLLEKYLMILMLLPSKALRLPHLKETLFSIKYSMNDFFQ